MTKLKADALFSVLLSLALILTGMPERSQATSTPPLRHLPLADPHPAPAHLAYPLEDGYIHNWLVAGPLATPVANLARFQGPDAVLQIANHYRAQSQVIAERPAERDDLQLGDEELRWVYYHCLEDHLVHMDTSTSRPHYLSAWAYTQITSPVPRQVDFGLSSHGPADVWLNGRHIHRQEQISRDLTSVPWKGTLKAGRNDVLVRLEHVTPSSVPYAMALRIVGLSDGGVYISIPTRAKNVDRRVMLEHLFEQAHLEHEVERWWNDLILHWSRDLSASPSYTVRFEDRRSRIYQEGTWPARAGRPQTINLLGHWEGEYRALLMSTPREWYSGTARVLREIPFYVVDNAYADRPYGTYEERRIEALLDASRRWDGLYSQIARLALGRWNSFHSEVVLEVAAAIDEHRPQASADMVGLLGLLDRYAGHPLFPIDLERCLDEILPISSYWARGSRGRETASQELLHRTSQLLAGQRYPDQVLTHTSRSGRWHRRQGERWIRGWLKARFRHGFPIWDTQDDVETTAVALSHLTDLADDKAIRDLSTRVLDKLFLSMAQHTYRGAFSSATHGRTDTSTLKSARLEATTGIGRLLWGMGILNRHILGTVSLAYSSYKLPPAIGGAATDLSRELWIQEKRFLDARGRETAVKATYRTRDYMLSSVQNYRPGQRGDREHIWQATLGSDALVYVNHPANMNQANQSGPGFWLGNHTLPHVTHWKNTLVAAYTLPADDWMGFTHAYFPIYEFDEVLIQDGWAFARVGDGYLALTAAQSFELVERGPGAYRELRSYGRENVWACVTGRAATDGSFEAFQHAVIAMRMDLDASSGQLEALHGEPIHFARP